MCLKIYVKNADSIAVDIRIYLVVVKCSIFSLITN